jgi:hypothetical protein
VFCRFKEERRWNKSFCFPLGIPPTGMRRSSSLGENGRSTGYMLGRPSSVGRFLFSLLAEVPAAVLAAENCSWLADEAIANGIPVIVTAVVAVIVGI